MSMIFGMKPAPIPCCLCGEGLPPIRLHDLRHGAATMDTLISLGTLAAFFRTATRPTHRALDDARATVDVLHGLIGEMARGR